MMREIRKILKTPIGASLTDHAKEVMRQLPSSKIKALEVRCGRSRKRQLTQAHKEFQREKVGSIQANIISKK